MAFFALVRGPGPQVAVKEFPDVTTALREIRLIRATLLGGADNAAEVQKVADKYPPAR